MAIESCRCACCCDAPVPRTDGRSASSFYHLVLPRHTRARAVLCWYKSRLCTRIGLGIRAARSSYADANT